MDYAAEIAAARESFSVPVAEEALRKNVSTSDFVLLAIAQSTAPAFLSSVGIQLDRRIYRNRLMDHALTQHEWAIWILALVAASLVASSAKASSLTVDGGVSGLAYETGCTFSNTTTSASSISGGCEGPLSTSPGYPWTGAASFTGTATYSEKPPPQRRWLR